MTMHALNRYAVEMVKPDKCIRKCHIYSNEAAICDGCFLCDGNFCVYETVDIEYAEGSYETNYKYDKPRTRYFEQFCCPNCGLLIVQDSTYMIQWKNEDIRCKKCGANYVCIDDNWQKNILTLARKPT